MEERLPGAQLRDARASSEVPFEGQAMRGRLVHEIDTEHLYKSICAALARQVLRIVTSQSRTLRFRRRFLPVWAVGLVGVAALLLQEPPAALLDHAPQLHELPGLFVRLLLLVNPLILVTAMAAVGAALAHRADLRSALAGDARARIDVRAALVVGFGLALVLMVGDAATAGLLGPDWGDFLARAASDPWLPALVLGVLYGGLAEEVIMRWGLMSAVVWAVLRMQRSRSSDCARPSAVAAWIGIAIAAAVFAVGHLPALSHSVALSGPIVARTVGLNLLAGVAYGWLFWRRSLECAMLAHASTHVGFALARWLA